MKDEAETGTLIIQLHREAIERIVLLWASNAGLLGEGEEVCVDWLSSQLEVLSPDTTTYIRICQPE